MLLSATASHTLTKGMLEALKVNYFVAGLKRVTTESFLNAELEYL
jgi:hypothetical protein